MKILVFICCSISFLFSAPGNFSLEDIDKMYQGSDFISKKTFTKTIDKISEIKKISNKKSDYILLFTSFSVPNRHFSNILNEVGLLQKEGIDISTRQYYVGIDGDFKKDVFTLKDSLSKISEKKAKRVIKNTKIKLDPSLFKNFNIRKVPVLVLASCSGLNPSINTCTFKSISRGDFSLLRFFELYKQYNKKYEKHFTTLSHLK